MMGDACAEQLREYALGVLEDWRRPTRWRPALQLRALSFSSARDYAGRFLLELLQNAHDAHPKERHDGQVHVLLDEDEGEWGTLYVANGGAPFTWQNVEDVCKIAQSSKVIGEGIGNKGVGFRSVLLISEEPEIYSSDPDGPGGSELDGYCFRFARESDVVGLLGDAETARKAVAEFPPFQIPFPVEEVPTVCGELAELGHVTVVRLPLRSDAARTEARLRLEELAEAKAPIMLFLDRLSRLVLERRVDGEVCEVHELTRAERPFAPEGASPAALSVAEVDLGTTGVFLVARGKVARERLDQTLLEAVDRGLLDDKWRQWGESAVIEIAVPFAASGKTRSGQTYTFLPLGEGVTAPFAGHVNAPFFTKMDRTDLDREHPLNAMLFDALAETCLAASAWLRTVSNPRLRQMAVDLVSWGSRYAGLLVTAARHVHGCELAEVPLVPVIASDDAAPHMTWASPRRAVLWPDLDLSVLTAQRAHESGAVVADPELGSERLRRLAVMCERLKCPWEPTLEALADHVERMAATLPLPGPEGSGSVDVWRVLYDDLAALFEEDGRVLRGRRLLLADDGTLRQANGDAEPGGSEGKRTSRRARRDAFFQPVRGETDDAQALSVPAVLGKRLFYLHPGLTWTEGTGHVRRLPARTFLESAGLVRPFDMKGLLEHVSRALAESKDHKLRLQALRFVFRLWRARRTSGGFAASSLGLRSLGLYVPSTDGALIEANGAAFGRGWDGTTGEDLAAVVTAGQEASQSLRGIAKRLIAAPDAFVKRGETADEWRAFLAEAGVADGLTPVFSRGAKTRANGNELTTRPLVRMANVPAEVVAQWEPHINRPQSNARYPQTPYTGTPAYWLPGQDVVERLGESARLAYARLVLRGLAYWREAFFVSTWSSAGSRRDDQEQVLTPLAAFIREQPWLPVRGRDRVVQFVRPADAWHCPPGLDEEPSYAPTVDHRIRHLLEPEKVGTRLRSMGLPTWDFPGDSARLIIALGRFVAEGAVSGEDRPAAQRANERAWRHFVQQPYSTLPGDALLLAESGTRLVSVPLSELTGTETVLYVSGERDGLTARLVREMEFPLLLVPGAAAQAADRLSLGRPKAVRHVDHATFSVTVDGEKVNPAAMGELIVDYLPWLTLAVGVLADHVADGPRPSEAELTELTSVVRRIRLYRYGSWDIKLDGRTVTMPDRLGGILPLDDPKYPLLLARQGDADWAEVARLSEALADLLGHREYRIRLRLAALQLGSCHADMRSPAPDELAEALGVMVHQVEETGRRIDGAIGVVLKRCQPILVHILGFDTANALTVPPPRDTKEFQAALEKYANELPLPPDQFIARARAARGIDELRLALGIDFAALNDTLRSLVPSHDPVSHADAHEEAVRTYLDLHKKELVNRLRWATKNDFDARRPLADWPSLRSLDWITAPAAWAYTVDVADDELLERHVEEQLTLRLDGPAPRKGDHLPAIDQVRSGNHRMVASATADLIALVKAAGRTLPAALASTNPAESITAHLDKAGALDFRLLTPDDVVAWLAVLGHWPHGMPTTTDPGQHGLTIVDLDRVRHAAEHERRERERRRRTISVSGREFDVQSGDFAELTAELQRALDKGAVPGLAGGRAIFTRPRPLEPAGRTSATGRRRGGGHSGAADAGLSPAQREAIGYVGEWYAYQWLRGHYSAGVDETSWVSSNRRKAFPGPPGDDSLGFDFKVGSGKRPMMFEVKATQGDGGQIELGESEVRAAQQHAGSERWRLLVITSILAPERVNIQMLPNPFSKDGRGRYREEGGALRFSYRL
ncbi:hypothetical protein ABT173_22700 [Streptomyces sp. NPDC001795]|uniref:sacsin N-terminal ATP-binding-like domain-containing protein n=1 Tax=Streptomyces sp. NPDC001795 TaxID=3154525 RepID=UPI00332A0443